MTPSSKPAESSMPPERETELEATLRRLHFEGPDPGLRQRTLRDVRQALDTATEAAGNRSWIWRPVWIAAGLLLMVWALPRGLVLPPSEVASTNPNSALVAAWLDLDEDLARHVSTRLTVSPPSRSLSTPSKHKGSSSHGRYELDFTNL